MHCFVEPHAPENFIHYPVEPHAIENPFILFFPMEHYTLATRMHFPMEPHALETLMYCPMELMLWKTSCITLQSLMLWKLSCITLWSVMLWRTFIHFPIELHALATPFLLVLILGSRKNLQSLHFPYHLLVNATHIFIQIHLAYEFKQHNLGSNHTFTILQQHFPHFTTFLHFKQFLLYSSQSTLYFL